MTLRWFQAKPIIVLLSAMLAATWGGTRPGQKDKS